MGFDNNRFLFVCRSFYPCCKHFRSFSSSSVLCCQSSVCLFVNTFNQAIFILSTITLLKQLFLLHWHHSERIIFWGVQRLIVYYHSKRKDQKFPPEDNHEILETYDTSRREVIKNLAVIPLFGAVFFGMAKKRGWISFEEENLAAKPDAVSSASLLLGKNHCR